jgi:hypothetical protein
MSENYYAFLCVYFLKARQVRVHLQSLNYFMDKKALAYL